MQDNLGAYILGYFPTYFRWNSIRVITVGIRLTNCFIIIKYYSLTKRQDGTDIAQVFSLIDCLE